jgi:NDP-sugar pyrophosphorylase family protein
MSVSLPERAMLLAAGIGKRLRPLTSYFAKSAMPLLGRPLVEYALRSLGRQGIQEVVVNLHHRPETLEPSLERASLDMRIHRSLEPELLGTAGGLKKAAEFLRDGPFFLLNGDTVAEVDYGRLSQIHGETGARATLLLRRKPAGSSYTGIRVGEGGRILGMERRDGSSDLMFAGVWLLDPSVLELLSGKPRGLEQELLPRLIEEGSAFGTVATDPWVTIDTPRRYWEASLILVRDGFFEQDWDVRRRPIEVVDGVTARVLAGADTRVEEGVRFRGSVILGARCHVARGARLENVVCWDDVTLPEGVTVSNTVVTHGVTLPPKVVVSDKVILSLGTKPEGLRRREIRDGLVVADLKTGRTANL